MKENLHRSACVAALLFASHALADDPAPRLPCEGGLPIPAYAQAGEPAMQTWAGLQWQPPPCLAWPASQYKLVIAIAGMVRAPDDAALRARVGAISAMRGLRYWSVSENAARVLIKDAYAINGPGGSRRADFSADEIRPGAVMHFVEEDNRSSAAVEYRMHVLAATRDQLIIETENVTPIESFMVKLFPPGALRAAYVMTRIDGNNWGFYAVSASTDAANNLVKLAKASHANRARALYSHFAGSEVPAVRTP